MTENLWSRNTPDRFWRLLVDVPIDVWLDSIQQAIVTSTLSNYGPDLDNINEAMLGEARFGNSRWDLSLSKKIYYIVKPLLPRKFTRILRKGYKPGKRLINYPQEERYIRFLWSVLGYVMRFMSQDTMEIVDFWKNKSVCALVLTHDVETEEGLRFLPKVVDLEKSMGFRSSFNLIPERYKIKPDLIESLVKEGFEVGVHGLKHDGKLFFSETIFKKRAHIINRYIKEFHADGFRAPLMHRQPEWMQALDIKYDLSFFDTDPYEAIPGGCGHIFPYQLGKFIELPYTLVQDYSLINILGEQNSDQWMKKISFLEKYHGMILVNVHPDYLQNKINWSVYKEFLQLVQDKNYWFALPKEVASWWKRRMYLRIEDLQDAVVTKVHLESGEIVFR